jgi:glycosyltransferase involved in cell wall biosynthesis
MKVCFINSLYPPYHRGGAEIKVAEETKRRKEAGDDVVVITIKPWAGFGSLCYKLENQNGIRVYRFYPLNIFSFININQKFFSFRLVWHFFDIFNFHSYYVVTRILKKERPDLILIHNVKGLGYLTWLAARKFGNKNVYILHDIQLVEPSGLLKVGEEPRLESWIYQRYINLCRFLVGSPKEIISPSRWLLNFYQRRGFFPRSQKTVNLAFGQLPEVKPLNLKPRKKPVRFLYLGQIEVHKGIIFLIKILQDLGNQGQEWELGIAGLGSRLEAVKGLVAGDERFKVYGWLTVQERDELIKRSHFLVVPSLVYENSPNNISESLKLGVPVVAAAVGGIPEMIQEGVNGYLFPVGVAGELKKVLVAILKGY